MRLIELSPAGALEALAVEEAVLEAVDSGSADEAWLGWTSPGRCAVLGTARPAARDLFLERLEADGVPAWRRRSGGGTVLLGPESPAVTMIARFDSGRGGGANINESYRVFCETLSAVFARLGLPTGFEPPADLACRGRKIAGLAQRRKRAAVLVTASVLAAPLADDCARYIREPSAEDSPAYRAGRRHGDFMTSLARETGGALADPAAAFREAFRAELVARGAVLVLPTAAEAGRAPDIARELAERDWRFRF